MEVTDKKKLLESAIVSIEALIDLEAKKVVTLKELRQGLVQMLDKENSDE